MEDSTSTVVDAEPDSIASVSMDVGVSPANLATGMSSIAIDIVPPPMTTDTSAISVAACISPSCMAVSMVPAPITDSISSAPLLSDISTVSKAPDLSPDVIYLDLTEKDEEMPQSLSDNSIERRITSLGGHGVLGHSPDPMTNPTKTPTQAIPRLSGAKRRKMAILAAAAKGKRTRPRKRKNKPKNYNSIATTSKPPPGDSKIPKRKASQIPSPWDNSREIKERRLDRNTPSSTGRSVWQNDRTRQEGYRAEMTRPSSISQRESGRAYSKTSYRMTNETDRRPISGGIQTPIWDISSLARDYFKESPRDARYEGRVWHDSTYNEKVFDGRPWADSRESQSDKYDGRLWNTSKESQRGRFDGESTWDRFRESQGDSSIESSRYNFREVQGDSFRESPKDRFDTTAERRQWRNERSKQTDPRMGADGARPRATVGNTAGGTFGQDSVPHKMAIAPDGFPTERFSPEQAKIIQKTILSEVFKCDPSTGPQFTNSYAKDGVVYITCANQQAMVWLTRTVDVIEPWPGARLRIGPAKDIVKTTKIAVRIPNSDLLNLKRPQDILSLLHTQNRGLETEEWKVVNCKVEPKGTTVVADINAKSLQALSDANFTGYLGFNKLTFRVLHKSKRFTDRQGSRGRPTPR